MSRRRRRVIFLLGFMGCGKTTVGARLARGLGWPFIDLDATIEAGQGVTIKEIFEAFFRAIEHAALAEASKAEPVVIALGGGTFVQKPNLDLIREVNGATIWLDCPLEELRRRCETINNRPLFKDQASFEQLFAQRLPFYQLAEYRIPTAGLTPQEIVEQILRQRIV
jgi:shikimate kinase